MHSWPILGLLTVTYLVSVLDRYLISVALPGMKMELHLTDTQLGLLSGPAFAASYALFSLPMGRFTDVFHRFRLIAFGTIIWSLATAAIGFSSTFTAIFIAIACVGMGEATVFPAGTSLIASYFSREKVGRATGVFLTGSSFGKILAFVGGGAVLALLTEQGGWHLGRDLSPWRGLFILAAVPGLFLAAIFLLLRDPPRRQETQPTIREALAHLGSRKAAYFLHLSYASCAILANTVLATWSPSFYVREFSLDISTAAILSGLVTAISAPLGFLVGGAALDAMRHIKGAPVLLVALSMALSIPCMLAFTSVDNLIVSLAGYSLAQAAIQICGPAAVVGMQMLTPAPHRGLAMSLYVTATILCAAGLGPVLIGVLNDRFFAGQDLALSLSVVLAGFAGLGAGLALLSRGVFARAVVEDD